MFQQRRRDLRNLGRRLPLSEDNLWKPLADGAVMVYFRKAQILVRQVSNQPDNLIGGTPACLELR